MGFVTRIRRAFGTTKDEPHADGLAEVRTGDAAYDDWDVVHDFDDLGTARAFRQSLTDRGVEAVLTADWPLDEFGRGDIALRVRPGQGVEAEEMLEPD